MRKLAIAGLIVLAMPLGALGVARALLPNTACVFNEPQMETLVLEKMSYADVKATLGCDGVLTGRQDYGVYGVIEDYSWRGDAWPYGKFDGHFINGTLHGTSKIWLSLKLSDKKV